MRPLAESASPALGSPVLASPTLASPPIDGPVPVGPLAAQPVPVAALAAYAWRNRAGAVAHAYLSLTKPRIIELLLVTTVPAMFLARDRFPGIGLTLVVLMAGALAAGAANVLNCYLDRDIDQVMRRTSRRPLPSHAVSARAAVAFGLVLAVVSVGLMAAFTTWLATTLTAAAIAYYDLVYTLWLKRRTSQSTFWGGVCGALPVLIGWAAVTGGLTLTALLAFGIVFFWQMPHFYALAIKFRDDYARAGIPMLPVVASPRRVAIEIVVFSWLTVATSLALWPLGMTPLYGVVAVVVGVLLLVEAHRVYGRARRGQPARAIRLFHWSTTYLTLLFVTIAVDALIH